MTAVDLPALTSGLAAAACCGVGGALVPSVVGRLPRPRDLAAGEAGPDYPRLASLPALRPVSVVLGFALGFVLGHRLGAEPLLPAWCLLAVAGLVLSYVDLREHRLPDAVVAPTALGLLVLLAAAALTAGDPRPLVRAGIGGAASAGLLLVTALVRPGGMGLGDAKVVGLTGAALGWQSWSAPVLGLFAGLLLGGLVGGVLLATGRVDRRTPIPLGPALIAGALLVALLHGP